MDRLYMENYLLVLKSTVEVYVHGTLESSNVDIHEVLKKGLDNTMDRQNKTYLMMTEKNWYNVSNVENSVISKTLAKMDSQNKEHLN